MKAAVQVRILPRQPILAFDRSVVKQDHGWPTPSNRRGSTFPSDHFHLPRGVIRSASVSETEGPGAKPGEAATFPFQLRTNTRYEKVRFV